MDWGWGIHYYTSTFHQTYYSVFYMSDENDSPLFRVLKEATLMFSLAIPILWHIIVAKMSVYQR